MNCPLINLQTPARHRSITGEGEQAGTQCLRLQHSLSLRMPIEDNTSNGIPGFIDLPRQVFSLTYLEDDQTHNPDSLGALDELKKRLWKTYLMGYLYNFNYKQQEIERLQECLSRELTNEVPLEDDNMEYCCTVRVSEDLSPTENDNNALVITISLVNLEESKQLLQAYMISWCNPVKTRRPMLPIMLCNGPTKIQIVFLKTLTKWFDVSPKPLTLMQEDMIHLSTYCLIMLGEHDSGEATLVYKIGPGTIEFSINIQDLLKLWSHIHTEGTDEVHVDDVLKFHTALERFIETTLGFKLNCAQFLHMKVKRHFYLKVNSQIFSTSTKIFHVMLKYLNYMAVQRLKVKYSEQIHEASVSSDIQ